jgi:hypothetical protein
MKDKKQLILNINSPEDLNRIEEDKNIKYINIDITNPNKKVIDYLLTNGQNLLFSEVVDGKSGYIYVEYEIFKKGQLLINEIIRSIPQSFSNLEKSKYLYIKLGSFIGYDINSIPNKTESINLSAINTVNNIWGAMTKARATNETISLIYFYLCRLAEIECKIITINKNGYKKNIITIDNTEMILDLTQDIPYIQGNFKTRFFGTYNDDEELDKKIGYIKDEYNERKLEIVLKNLDYTSSNLIEQILLKTQNIIKVSNIQPIELGITYNNVFNKYCPNYDISINNLYIKDKNNQEHFILITYGGKHYSFNYSKNSFVEIKQEELEKNIETKRIGIYNDEEIPNLNTNKTKVA